MRVVAWLSRQFPYGMYAGPARSLFVWLYNNVSIGARIRAHVRGSLNLGEKEKTPPSLAEAYQLIAIVMALVLLALADALPKSGARVVGVLALYRPFEILVLTTNWLLIDRAAIHSYGRSLALFVINILEVVLFFAAAYVGLSCVAGPNAPATALYSSLRTSVTIGPTSTVELPDSLCCGGVLMTQIALSYFLAVVVVAHGVGALRKREEVLKKPAA